MAQRANQIPANDTSDFFAQGVRSFVFKKEGDTVSGVIEFKELRQQTNVDTQEPEFWKDNRPKMQVVVHLQTDLRDEEEEEDGGLRAIYVRANLRAAVQEALKKAGEADIAIGGTLTVTYDSTDKPTRRGYDGRKNYTAEYIAP